MGDYAILNARFTHMEHAQWEHQIKEVALSTVSGKVSPKTYKKAMLSDDKVHWEHAVGDELQKLEESGCLEQVSAIPHGAACLNSTWDMKWKEPIGDDGDWRAHA